MRNLLAVCFLLLFALPLVAQEEQKVVIEYPYKRSDYNLDLFPKVKFGAGVKVGTRPLNRADFLLGLEAAYRYDDLGYVSLSADIPALPRFDYQYEHLQNEPQLQTTNDFYVYSAFDFGVGIFIKDTLLKRHIVFRADPDDSLFLEPFVEYREPTRRTLAVRTGFNFYQSIINNQYLDEPMLIDDQGREVAPGGPGTVFQPGSGVYHTNMRTSSLYLGCDMRWISNNTSQRDDEPVKVKRMLRVYGDLMLAPRIDIDPMYVRDFETGRQIRHIVAHDNGGGFEKRVLGFRIGGEYLYYMKAANDMSGFSFNLETGIKPGVANLATNDSPLGGNLFIAGKVAYLFGFGE